MVLNGFMVFALVLALLAIIIILLGVKPVPQGTQFTVERFGKYIRTLEPGLNLIIPFIDRVSRRLSMMEEVMDVAPQEVITKDNAMVRVDGVVFYQIIDAAKAAYEVKELSKAILNLTMTNIRNVMGSMDLDELLSKRDEINHQLLRVVDEATNPWGVKVLRVEIKDIEPPKDLIESMARQMKAERDRRAVILESEGQKRAVVLEAEGRKEAAFLDAQARERLAEAEANATIVVSKAISEGSVHAINYFVAQRYVDVLGKIASAPNEKVIMIPLEASSIIGALEGISQIAKETFHPKSPQP
jgi:regulator of protease activity HflC (stomatin/prohibitin superfamily)